MARVVREGTARAAVCGLNGVFSVAAKTGTAEVDEATRRNNAWIVGYAPAQPRPRYVIVVCLEHVRDQSHGGETAGPVMAAALAYLDRMDPGAGIALGGAR